MKFVPFQVLQTQRLLLRKFRSEDAEAFFSCLGSSEKVTRYMLWQPLQNISEAESGIQRVLMRYQSAQPYTWAVTLKDSDQLIGRIDLLRFDEETGTCSFAYMLGEEFWNCGYGTEAVEAVFDFAFSELEVSMIEADHMAGNPASGAVMRKAGMTCLGVTPQKYEKNGVWHDAVSYRIMRKEWLHR